MKAEDCKPGQEQHETYKSAAGKLAVQYDYRTKDGELFSTVAPDLQTARARLDAWLADRHDRMGADDEEIEEPHIPDSAPCFSCGNGFSEPDPDCPDCGGTGMIYS